MGKIGIPCFFFPGKVFSFPAGIRPKTFQFSMKKPACLSWLGEFFPERGMDEKIHS